MNIVDALDFQGIEYKPHSSREDEVFLCCPFCVEEGTTPDTRFRLGVNVTDGKMQCFNCGKKSSNADYTWKELQRVLDTGQLEAALKTKKKLRPKKPVKLPEDFQIINMAKKMPDHWHQVAVEYLRMRNLTAKQVREAELGYSTVGEFRYRIIVPVYYNGKLKGIVARTFVQALKPKYKNSIGQKIIYGLPDTPKKKVVLVEGAFDKLAIAKAVGSIYDSGAVLGHSLTDKQLEQLKPYEEVVLWPDPDEAGVRGFLKMAMQLKDKKVELVLPEFNGKEDYDPSELFSEEIRVKLRKRVPYSSSIEDSMKAALAFQEIDND